MEFIYNVFYYVKHHTIDVALFMFIDRLVKYLLNHVKAEHKCHVWKLETGILLIMCLYRYYSCYTPYLLMLITIGPFLFSWNIVKNSCVYLYYAYVRENNLSEKSTPKIKKYFNYVQNPSSYEHNYESSKTNEHNYESSKTSNIQATLTSNNSKINKCGEILSNVLSSTKRTTNMPPGVSNFGQNVCFINVGLLCLAHTPTFLPKLEEAIRMQENKSAFLISLKNILQKCNQMSSLAIDGKPFYEAASKLRPNLVADPNSRTQKQQDAAEFLTWIFDFIQSSLHKGKNLNYMDKQIWRSFLSGEYSWLKSQLKFDSWTDVFLNNLKIKCQSNLKKACYSGQTFQLETIQHLSDLEWIIHKKYNSSPIDDLFIGQLVDGFQCLACENLKVNVYPFMILPLPIVIADDGAVIHLQDCIRHLELNEKLQGTNGLRCMCCNHEDDPNYSVPSLHAISHYNLSKHMGKYKPFCIAKHMIEGQTHHDDPDLLMSPIPDLEGGYSGSSLQSTVKTSTPKTLTPVHLTDAVKKTMLGQLPDFLIIQLLRFNFNYNDKVSNKIQQPVYIPLTNLELSSPLFFNSDPSNYKYDLYAICLHEGGKMISSGHYVALCLCEDGNWYKFDDHKVTKVSMEFEYTANYVQENAYILFYKRRTIDL